MRIEAVCVGQARPLLVGGRRVLSAIGKSPVTGRVNVHVLGLQGDEQADLNVHGGLGKAVYVYPIEHLPMWQAARQTHDLLAEQTPIPPGFLGENLLISGLLEHEVWVGDTLLLPGCTLRVTAPREPCFKFNAVMGFSQAARMMVDHSACGFYCAVEMPGSLSTGDEFKLMAGQRSLSIADAFAAKRVKHLR